MNNILSSYKQKNHWSLGLMVVAIGLALSLMFIDKNYSELGAVIITLTLVFLTLSITIGIFASKQEKYEKERERLGYPPESGMVIDLTTFYIDDFISHFNQIYFKSHDLLLSPGELAHQINSGYCVNLCVDVLNNLSKHGIFGSIVKGNSHWFIEIKEHGFLQKPFYFDAYYRTGISNPDCISEYGANKTSVIEALSIPEIRTRYEQWVWDQQNGRGVYINTTLNNNWIPGITDRIQLDVFRKIYGDTNRSLAPYQWDNTVNDKFE